MKLFRDHDLAITNEIRFYLKLRTKQIVGESEASLTIDECACNDLRAKYTTENPKWVLAWEVHCEARQAAKKTYDKIEADALHNYSLPVSSPNKNERGREKDIMIE